MNKNNDAFSEEYDIKAVTDSISDSTEEIKEEKVIADEEHYDVSKPIRVIIKARIVRDED